MGAVDGDVDVVEVRGGGVGAGVAGRGLAAASPAFVGAGGGPEVFAPDHVGDAEGGGVGAGPFRDLRAERDAGWGEVVGDHHVDGATRTVIFRVAGADAEQRSDLRPLRAWMQRITRSASGV